MKTSRQLLRTGGRLLPALRLSALLVSHGLGWAAAGQAPVLHETDREFIGSHDIDGDAVPDFILVDRTTGEVLLGRPDRTGTLVWQGPWPSGIGDLTGAAFLQTGGTWSIAVTAPPANRVGILRLGDGVSSTLHAPGIGPDTVIGLPVGGAGDDGDPATDDLFVGSRWNDPPAAFGIGLAYSDGTAAAGLQKGSPIRRGQPVWMQPNGNSLAGALARATDGSEEFQAWDTSTGVAIVVAVATGLARGTDYLVERFGTAAVPRYLFHVPGTRTLEVRTPRALTPNRFELPAGREFQLGDAIEDLLAVEVGGSMRLLAFLPGGGVLDVYAFDGESEPVRIHRFAAAVGERFTGAVAAGGQDLHLLAGSSAGGGTTIWERQRWNTGLQRFERVARGTLPVRSALGSRPNVMTFRDEPFVSDAPGPVGEFSVGDWTSKPVAGAGSIGVTAESFRDSGSGLGSPRPVNVPTGNPPARFALVNQMAPGISVFSYSRPGQPGANFAVIDPPGGRFQTAVTITLRSATAPATIRYRIGETSWIAYDQPIHLEGIADGVVLRLDAYAIDGSGPSPVRTAEFRFGNGTPVAVSPGADANGNGLADAWEALFGQSDPNADPDRDGISNLAEQAAGTDPLGPGASGNSEDIGLVAEPGPAGALEISWDADASVVLEQSDRLDGNWTGQPDAGQVTGTRRKVTLQLPDGDGASFWRLRLK